MASVPPFSALPARAHDGVASIVLHGTRNPPGSAAHDRLVAYKRIADELLPFMRSRGHLHHLIFRDRSAASAVVLAGDADAPECVLGGATFRLFLLDGELAAAAAAATAAAAADGGGGARARAGVQRVPPVLLMDILATAVAQRIGACGRGHGTRLINALKAHLAREARARRALPALLTQSDDGPQALAFWARQGLRAGEGAAACVQLLAQRDARSHLVYDYSVPMLAAGASALARVAPKPSERAERDAAQTAMEGEAGGGHAGAGGDGRTDALVALVAAAEMGAGGERAGARVEAEVASALREVGVASALRALRIATERARARDAVAAALERAAGNEGNEGSGGSASDGDDDGAEVDDVDDADERQLRLLCAVAAGAERAARVPARAAAPGTAGATSDADSGHRALSLSGSGNDGGGAGCERQDGRGNDGGRPSFTRKDVGASPERGAAARAPAPPADPRASSPSPPLPVISWRRVGPALAQQSLAAPAAPAAPARAEARDALAAVHRQPPAQRLAAQPPHWAHARADMAPARAAPSAAANGAATLPAVQRPTPALKLPAVERCSLYGGDPEPSVLDLWRDLLAALVARSRDALAHATSTDAWPPHGGATDAAPPVAAVGGAERAPRLSAVAPFSRSAAGFGAVRPTSYDPSYDPCCNPSYDPSHMPWPSRALSARAPSGDGDGGPFAPSAQLAAGCGAAGASAPRASFKRPTIARLRAASCGPAPPTAASAGGGALPARGAAHARPPLGGGALLAPQGASLPACTYGVSEDWRGGGGGFDNSNGVFAPFERRARAKAARAAQRANGCGRGRERAAADAPGFAGAARPLGAAAASAGDARARSDGMLALPLAALGHAAKRSRHAPSPLEALGLSPAPCAGHGPPRAVGAVGGTPPWRPPSAARMTPPGLAAAAAAAVARARSLAAAALAAHAANVTHGAPASTAPCANAAAVTATARGATFAPPRAADPALAAEAMSLVYAVHSGAAADARAALELGENAPPPATAPPTLPQPPAAAAVAGAGAGAGAGGAACAERTVAHRRGALLKLARALERGPELRAALLRRGVLRALERCLSASTATMLRAAWAPAAPPAGDADDARAQRAPPPLAPAAAAHVAAAASAEATVRVAALRALERLAPHVCPSMLATSPGLAETLAACARAHSPKPFQKVTATMAAVGTDAYAGMVERELAARVCAALVDAARARAPPPPQQQQPQPQPAPQPPQPPPPQPQPQPQPPQQLPQQQPPSPPQPAERKRAAGAPAAAPSMVCEYARRQARVAAFQTAKREREPSVERARPDAAPLAARAANGAASGRVERGHAASTDDGATDAAARRARHRRHEAVRLAKAALSRAFQGGELSRAEFKSIVVAVEARFVRAGLDRRVDEAHAAGAAAGVALGADEEAAVRAWTLEALAGAASAGAAGQRCSAMPTALQHPPETF
ncbi:hypothetical protein KFE25_010397 [Diacronema lutheri]|uniref:Uncharacterized protein n=1 Tax=Diacronema lutheri TaxID=2081491 RepID=A0A8J5XJM5_DIALT|nr:hypothetical protein KFE25_010397 [Diacronema lutheri]